MVKRKRSRIRTSTSFLVHMKEYFRDRTISNVHKKRVWNVITALRGPDDENTFLKEATTAVIRHKVMGGHIPVGAIINPDNDVYAKHRRNMDARYDHFSRHVMYAFDALKLDWNGTNK
jgi:hypothetical protein